MTADSIGGAPAASVVGRTTRVSPAAKLAAAAVAEELDSESMGFGELTRTGLCAV